MLKQFSTALLILSASAVSADDLSAIRHAEMMVKHWRCAVYSSFMDETPLFEQHTEAGYVEGKSLFVALDNNRISQSSLEDILPLDISSAMSGPSTEFALGRVFQVIIGDAQNSFLESYRSMTELRQQGKESYNNLRCALIVDLKKMPDSHKTIGQVNGERSN